MSKDRKCYNCVHYTQAAYTPAGATPSTSGYTGTRCQKLLNPALIDAPAVAMFIPHREYAADEMAGFCDHYVWAPIGYQKLRASARGKISSHGDKFSTANLSEKFAFWYEKGDDIKLKVQTSAGRWGTNYGHVAMSTGHRPTFLLMPNIKARGSSVLLSDGHEIVGIRDARFKNSKYKPVPTDLPWNYVSTKP